VSVLTVEKQKSQKLFDDAPETTFAPDRQSFRHYYK